MSDDAAVVTDASLVLPASAGNGPFSDAIFTPVFTDAAFPGSDDEVYGGVEEEGRTRSGRPSRS